MTVIVAGSELNLEISLLICQETLNIVALECQTSYDTYKHKQYFYICWQVHMPDWLCVHGGCLVSGSYMRY